MSKEQFNSYNNEQASDEASKMRERIESGEAENYSQAEKQIETKKELLELQKEIRRPSEVYLIMIDYEKSDMKECRYDESKIYPIILETNYSEMRHLMGGKGEGSGDHKNPELTKAFNEIYDAITVDVEERNDWKKLIEEKINGKNDLIDVLKEAEKNGLVRIVHIPAYYEDEQALCEKVKFPFQSKQELQNFMDTMKDKTEMKDKVNPIQVLGSEALERARNLDSATVKELMDKFEGKIDFSEIPFPHFEKIIKNLKDADKIKIIEDVLVKLDGKMNEKYEGMLKTEKEYILSHPGQTVRADGGFVGLLGKNVEANVQKRLDIMSNFSSNLIPNYKKHLEEIEKTFANMDRSYYRGKALENLHRDLEITKGKFGSTKIESN